MKLEDEREETPFAVRDNAIDLRKIITEFGFRSFGLKEREMPKQPKNWEQWSDKSKEDWVNNEEQKLRKAKNFDSWFVYNERSVLDIMLRKIVNDIDRANAINPQYLFECDEQRKLQDEVIGLCSNLKRELNYIGDVIPTNKNFITKTTKVINREINLVRGWRESCIDVRDKVLQKEIQRRKKVAEKQGFILMKEIDG